MAESFDAAAYRRQTPETGTPIAGDDPVYLQDPTLDATVRMLVELVAQVWVDRERLLVIEALLAERGVVTREAIENFHPSADRSTDFKAERDKFVDAIFKELRRVPTVPRD